MVKVRNKIKESNNMPETTGVVTRDGSEITGLVSRATGGDFEAFGELYGIFIEKIYRYVFYQVRDKMTAEDITEEVFLKAWKAIKSCKGKELTFSAWLYRIAHNQVVDHFRSQRKRLPPDVDDLTNIRDTGQRMESMVENEQLLELVACLPEQQRQVIILKFIEGVDNREIGQIMGKRQGAVRALQMRALTALRRQLSGEK